MKTSSSPSNTEKSLMHTLSAAHKLTEESRLTLRVRACVESSGNPGYTLKLRARRAGIDPSFLFLFRCRHTFRIPSRKVLAVVRSDADSHTYSSLFRLAGPLLSVTLLFDLFARSRPLSLSLFSPDLFALLRAHTGIPLYMYFPSFGFISAPLLICLCLWFCMTYFILILSSLFLFSPVPFVHLCLLLLHLTLSFSLSLSLFFLLIMYQISGRLGKKFLRFCSQKNRDS